MNKTLKTLRENQKIELNELLSVIETVKNEVHEAWKTVSEHDNMDEYRSKVKPYIDKREKIERRIEFLKTELIEKKYANCLGYSDVYPYEVIEEKTENCYSIRQMNSEETEQSQKDRLASFVPGGFCGHFDNEVQEWDITPNESAKIFNIRRHKDGYWYDKNGGKYNIESAPRKFYDFNF